jgi:hypothetical protein
LHTEPAAVPGLRPARTMYAALYGQLMMRPVPGEMDERTQDAYSLFYARSAAMGWLTPATVGATGGFWGMNDADATPAAGPQSHRVAWFQVVLTGPFPGELLPVQPFLACAGDAMARLGRLELDAVQVVLPERDPPAGGSLASASGRKIADPLIPSLNWLGDASPPLRVPVRVTLDGGADPSVRTAAPDIVQAMQEITQDVFACDSFSLADDDHLVLDRTPLDDPRTSPVRHPVTFGGTLIEWSLDALGWLAAFLADLSSRHGITAQLMLTAGPIARP